MDKSRMNEVIEAVTACAEGSYSVNKERAKTWQSKGGQWDYIVAILCAGCKKPLSSYENRHGLVFCYNCRKFLFPETVEPKKKAWNKPFYPAARGHFL